MTERTLLPVLSASKSAPMLDIILAYPIKWFVVPPEVWRWNMADRKDTVNVALYPTTSTLDQATVEQFDLDFAPTCDVAIYLLPSGEYVGLRRIK